MPTNTHSLFYTKVIDKVVVAELDNQKATLKDEVGLLDGGINIKYDNLIGQLNDQVRTLTNQFIAEIDHTDRLGLGPEAFNILINIEATCGKKPDSFFGNRHTKQRNTSPQERLRIKNHYIPQINNLLQQTVDKLNEKRNIEITRKDDKKKLLSNYIDKIEKVLAYLRDTEVPHQERIKAAQEVLGNAYGDTDYRDKILDNVEVLTDANAGHKDMNVESYKIYKTERLHSVFKLWGDYFKGRMSNLDFDMVYWIIISVIIDIAGLLFFAIAFRKTY